MSKLKFLTIYSWVILLILVLILGIKELYCGGNRIYVHSITINGMPPTTPVNQGQVISLCYSADAYLYSGRRFEYAYIVFTVGDKVSIKGSIGRGGKNFPNDVKLIQSLLNKLNVYHGNIDGRINELLITAIEKFQREYANQSPDGRIDINGRTLNVLEIEAAENVFIQLIGRIDSRDWERTLKKCVNFIAPTKVRKYEIRYNAFPLILAYPLGTEIEKDDLNITMLNISQEREVRNHLLIYARNMHKLFDLNVKLKEVETGHPFATSLRINNKFPSVSMRIKSGYSDKPVCFSWFTTPKYKNVKFRYRLYPDQIEWSSWDEINESEYYFISPGSHAFEVASKYIDKTGKWQETPITYYEFVLEKAFVSQPIITKGKRGHVIKKSKINIDNLYTSSKALLVGITEFEDSNFSPLPYVNEDISIMKTILSKLGFKIEILNGRVTRGEIITKIDDIITKAHKNDRILIYFSTHGFQDDKVKSRGYIACTDCYKNKPRLNCIELKFLEDLVKPAIHKPVKHLLILLDACSSGLGIITKSPEYQEISVATTSGAHMITAGMEDQEAQIDRSLKMSTFTYFLVDGLNGMADYTNDNMITLTELLVYIRYQVARKTGGTQTPMIGRISGTGEMIFEIKPQNNK